MFIALHHLETCAPQDRDVQAEYMSRVTERAIGMVGAINKLRLRSPDSSAKDVVADDPGHVAL